MPRSGGPDMRHLLASPVSCVIGLFCAVFVLACVPFDSDNLDVSKCRDPDVGAAIVEEAGAGESARGDGPNGDPRSFIPLLSDCTRVRQILRPRAASIPYTRRTSALRRPRVFAAERIPSVERHDLDPASQLA